MTGVVRPEVDAEAEVTAAGSRVSVSTRVERSGDTAIVVRPSSGEFVDQQVVRVGDRVQVFWREGAAGWALPADVSTVERGIAPRWHLTVAGPAEETQRREAVRARVARPVTLRVNGADLEAQSLDLSEAGTRVVVEAYGNPPLAGTRLAVVLQVEDGALTCAAEVVRQQTRGSRWQLSLHFVDLPENEQDRLRRRVFQALREERAGRTED
ncbi:flagellar brake protein [Geodermatophilus sp. CPCC 206100]|uniref:flagellar brake protein n=1 Tax=Geodermatophilus sp. CPCC 206100 TaxID=3020054 RepID=UPI003AFFF785